MKIGPKLFNLVVCSLTESLAQDTMLFLVKKFIPDYDLRTRAGLHDSVPISQNRAAAQILDDILAMDVFPQFINLLIEIHNHGYRAKHYQIAHINEVIHGVCGMGYFYDEKNAAFVEKVGKIKSRDWGALIAGNNYEFAFLRLDIVANSALVREHKKSVVESAYSDLLDIVDKTTGKRNGRLWMWEGDGGLCSFFYSDKVLLAVNSAVEILNEVYLYNKTGNPLSRPLKLRLAVHRGPCVFTSAESELKKSETIRETLKLESGFSAADSVALSPAVYTPLDPRIKPLFRKNRKKNTDYYLYTLRWEK